MTTTSTTNTAKEEEIPKILWSCIARNDIILAEAGDDYYQDGLVTETAQGLLARKPTPGYEFHQAPRKFQLQRRQNDSPYQPKLRGCKFHIYEHDTESVTKHDVIVWIFAAVYDTSAVELVQVQSFLEKIVALTEHFRQDDEWRSGETLSQQATFAPILLQRMQEVTYLGKMAMLEEQLDTSKQIMGSNIELLLDREEILRNQLDDKSSKLKEMAGAFQKRARKVRRMQKWQNAKHGLVMGTAVTAGVAVIVVPPLVALL